MDHKKNIFSMYRVLLLAVALPLVAVLLGVTTASTKATSKEVKSLTKNYMNCGKSERDQFQQRCYHRKCRILICDIRRECCIHGGDLSYD